MVEQAADGGRAVGRFHQIEQEVGLVLVELVGRPRPAALPAPPPHAAVCSRFPVGDFLNRPQTVAAEALVPERPARIGDPYAQGRAWESGLMVGLLFAMGSSPLLLPNPFMPEAVARVHLVETATSNFLFGWLVGWLLALPRISIGFSWWRGSTTVSWGK